MNKISSVEKFKLPYSLLLDAATGRAAAYTNTHNLITELASAKLVAFAEAHTSKRVPFDPAAHAEGLQGRKRPLPAWATQEVIPRLEVLWIQRPTGDAPDAEWRAIPAR